MNEELNAKRSLCWKCEYGLTVHETEQERVCHMGMNKISSDPPFDIEQDYPYPSFEEPAHKEEEESELIEHVVEHQRIKTICYWRPEGIKNSPPIGVANVTQCSRFKAQS